VREEVAREVQEQVRDTTNEAAEDEVGVVELEVDDGFIRVVQGHLAAVE
jgi:hypothetical protein